MLSLNKEQSISANLSVQWNKPSVAMQERIQTCITTRANYSGSFSTNSYNYKYNRAKLVRQYGLKHIQWLNQEHKDKLIRAPIYSKNPPRADASWTNLPRSACAILSADCLPVFFCNTEATQVAAAHAGWRGLAAGLLQKVIAAFPKGNKLYAAFGPAISNRAYEVGEDFISTFPQHKLTFVPVDGKNNHYYADLYAIATKILKDNGIDPPPIPQWCTYKDQNLFPSYRRYNTIGDDSYDRIANLIWLR